MGQLQLQTPQQLHPLWSFIPLLVVVKTWIKNHYYFMSTVTLIGPPFNQLVSSKRTVQTLQVGMCVQGRFKSVCASTKSEETLDPLLPIEHLSNAQADQSHQWAHMSTCTFCCGPAPMVLRCLSFETVDML